MSKSRKGRKISIPLRYNLEAKVPRSSFKTVSNFNSTKVQFGVRKIL